MGKELAATITAHRDQRARPAAGRPASHSPRTMRSTSAACRTSRRLGCGSAAKALSSAGAPGDELALPAGDPRMCGSRGRGGKRRGYHSEGQACATEGAGGAPSETVNTS